MGVTPALPEDTTAEIGDWQIDRDPYNGVAWFGDNRRVAVHVSAGIGKDAAYAKVRDERVSGGYSYIVGENTNISFREALEAAFDWMGANPPETWQHPRVEQAVFDVPAGYDLDHYGIGRQQQTIRYSLEAVPEQLHQVQVKISGYDSTDNWTLSIERHPVTRGHQEEIWNPEKGTPLLDVLARARQLCAGIRRRPAAITQPDAGELDIDDLLTSPPVTNPPNDGQAQLANYAGDGR